MATIQKRGQSYSIRVSCGYKTDGSQIIQSTTWKPTANMTPKQIEKELNRQAVLFEEKCLAGHQTAPVKFQEFAEIWFKEYAEIKLKTRTIQSYHWLEKRVYKAIGHLRIDRITPRHIQRFITELTETKCEDNKSDGVKTLSPKTVKLHISFISTVFDYGVKMQLVSANPCKSVSLPKIEQKEREIYTIEETQKLIDILLRESENPESMKFAVFYLVAIYTGFRRGELLGLEWADFDFEHNTVAVRRTSNFTKEKGTYTDTTKSKSSNRTLKLSAEVMEIISRFREQQSEERERMGDKWRDSDRLFVRDNGLPMYTNAPQRYFQKLCKKNGVRYLSNHNFRHLNASIMIYNGVDVKTIQSVMGHSSANTTLQIYAHAFQTAQARAMDVVTNVLPLRKADSA